MSDIREKIEEIDEKLQKEGWKFYGAILHYDKAWKNQASVYIKNGKYIVSGISSDGENILNDPISEKDAKKRVKESLQEIKKHLFNS